LVEVVALVTSLAALIVSSAALYLTSLRGADIEVDHIPRDNELEAGTFSGADPQSHAIRLAVSISNTGARGGLLEKIRVDHLKWLGRSDAFWTGIWRTVPIKATAGLELPIAFEAGDVEAVTLHVDLQPAGGSIEEQAARLAGMDRLGVTIHWTFVRRGWRGTREHVDRSESIEVDASGYRAATIQHWNESGFGALVAIAERGSGGVSS
jgi:hypothetical protein